ncbi:HPP [Bartonella choladocola]|uniref:HPP family protein n=1 Tax=Bartonella TaxID=773 RepID=UPI0018DB8243|nr:HPP family protein [Bartonella choladocola]
MSDLTDAPKSRMTLFLTSKTPARPSSLQILTGFAGGMVSILILAFMAGHYHVPLIMAPFGATCVLLYALPESPLAQPGSVIGGHLLSTFVGLAVFHLIGHGVWETGLAVGLAIGLMQFTRTIHAPAGADPIVVFLASCPGWSFLFAPVFLGSIILVAIAFVVNNIGAGKNWPKYWW